MQLEAAYLDMESKGTNTSELYAQRSCTVLWALDEILASPHMGFEE